MKAMCVRSPADLLAAVPVLFGFHPADSLVMITTGAARAFHIRTDLPSGVVTPERLDSLARMLLGPAVREGARAVCLVYYSAEAGLVAQVHRGLLARFRASQMPIRGAIRAADDRWFVVGPAPLVEAEGKPYDVRRHAFARRAQQAGWGPLASRAALAAQLETCAEAAAAVEAEEVGARVLNAAQARDLIEAHVGAGTLACDPEAAALLAAVVDPEVQTAVWWGVNPRAADRHVAFWLDLVPRAPVAAIAPACAVLAAVSWLAGRGALAWCAWERARDHGGVDGANGAGPLFATMTSVLTAGSPPIEDWSTVARVERRAG